MARLLLPAHPPLSTSQFSLAGATLFLCGFALFMCASHSLKWRRRFRACRGSSYHEPVVQHATQGIADESEDISVWQKNILMGGKCQLPDFSGVIIYDSNGNVVAPAKPPPALPLLTWK